MFHLFSEEFLGNFCIITNILLYLSGVQVIRNIMHRGSTHGISILPFLTCAVSCTIWLKYAIIKDDYVLFITNAVGTILEWVYVLIYLMYLPTDIGQNAPIRRWLTIQIVFMFGILLTCSRPKYTDQEFLNLTDFLVKVCVFTNICNYMSPLGQALYCYKSKTTENLSLLLNFTYWLQVMAWLMYGFLTGKTVVIIPNLFGSVLTTFTMSMFFMYPSRRRDSLKGISINGNYDERPTII